MYGLDLPDMFLVSVGVVWPGIGDEITEGSRLLGVMDEFSDVATGWT